MNENATSGQPEKLWSLEKLRGISRGNEAFVQKMFLLFQQQTQVRLLEMEKAAAENNFLQVGEIAHKMKPGLETFCIDSLKESVRSLEKSAENSEEKNRVQLELIVSTLRRVLSEMEAPSV